MNLRTKKLRFSRMFRPTFAASCGSQTTAQVIHRSVLIPRSISPPDSTRTVFSDADAASLSSPDSPQFPSRTLSERYPPSVLRDDDYHGRRCPPSTPMTPFMRRLPRPPGPSLGEIDTRSRVKPTEETKTKKEATVATEEEGKEKCPYNSSTTSQEDWFSSDDESDARLSSSQSLSSDSSENRRGRRRRTRSGVAGVGELQLGGGGGRDMEDSFAVVKRSSDPRGDFRRSMVEMIVEKEMFGAEELQKLLECFLALNSHHHHGVILQVFAEIWEALFSSRS